MPLLGSKNPETQETYFITLSEEQSAAILKQVKQLTSGSTINHLGHAAMTMALARCNPPTSLATTDTQFLWGPCWVNGRRYLLAAPGHPEPTADYIPPCISFRPVMFNINQLFAPKGARKADIKQTLFGACRYATAQYRMIVFDKCPLSACVLPFEGIAKKMRYLNPLLSLDLPYFMIDICMQVQTIMLRRKLGPVGYQDTSVGMSQPVSSSPCHHEHVRRHGADFLSTF